MRGNKKGQTNRQPGRRAGSSRVAVRYTDISDETSAHEQEIPNDDRIVQVGATAAKNDDGFDRFGSGPE